MDRKLVATELVKLARKLLGHEWHWERYEEKWITEEITTDEAKKLAKRYGFKIVNAPANIKTIDDIVAAKNEAAAVDLKKVNASLFFSKVTGMWSMMSEEKF